MLKIRDSVVIVTVLGYLLFNYGFMQLRVPPSAGSGLPLAEAVLLLSLLTFNYTSVLGRLSTVIAIVPLALWWAIGVSRALIGFSEHGIWAMRDAAHVLESFFLLAGFVVAGRDPERFWRLLPKFLVVAVAYSFLAPFDAWLWTISPKVTSGAGYLVPVFGSMSNAPYLLILAATYLILFHVKRPITLVAAALLIGSAVVMFQARTIYLVLIAVSGVLIFYRRSAFGSLASVAAILALGLAIVMLTGILLHGRLGHFSAEFMAAHFMAIFGVCNGSIESVCSAAAGVDQRLEWWSQIIDDMRSDWASMLLGLGYGVPLTDFYGASGAQVREPHNSYISILARTGIVGAVCWVLLMLSLVRRWHVAFEQCRAIGWRIGENRLLIMMVFFISMWVLAIGEDGFEKPYNIVPFYFFWGIALRMAYELKSVETVRYDNWTIRFRHQVAAARHS